MTEKLLAPNGKESNLTPEQYLLVRTSEFKKWFGDWEKLALTKLYDSGIDEISLKRLEDGVSKVVDSNGEPKVVLHGSKGFYDGKSTNNEEITEFSSSRLIFTTDNVDVAKYFGDFKEYFVNIKNPFVIKEGYNVWSRLDENTLIKTLGEKTFIDLVNWEWKEDFQNVSEWEKDAIENEPALITIDSLSIYLKEFKNYDGVIAFDIEETTMNISSNDYIAFKPNQIKLADGSNTTFDGSNPDIRFANGGEVDEKYQYVVDKIKKAIIDLGLPYLNEVDEFNRYYLSKSKNDFGQSWYIIFLQENRPLEIRISDHSVTSSSRIMDDKYIAMLDVYNPFKYQTAKGIAKSLDLEFKRLKDIREKRNKLFNEEREKRDYMNNKLQSFLDKLKSENKSIRKNDRTYQTLEEIIIKHPDWEYVYHYPNNGAFSFYFVKNDKSGSLSPHFINEQYFNFLNDNGYLDKFKRGGRTIAQTPAPKKERIYGSEKNKPESSKDTKSAEKIEFNEKTLETIKNKVAEHNENNPKKKVTLASAKAVVRRGMGAYSSSHRPTISGGKRNSRVAWGLARLNAFFYKIINGKSKSGKYSQDNDLIEELGYKVQKYADGGDIQAYEEAMGISQFDEGGETKPKKVYVSIQLSYEFKKIEKDSFGYSNNYFRKYDEKPFEELKNGVLEGLVGVSSSPNNIAEWFIHRDCLIVMDYEEFISLNETETINYYDPYQLMKNNLFLFKRLYANISRQGEQEGVYIQTLITICEKLVSEINLEMNVSEGQRSSELYRISRFLSPYENKAFTRWIEENSIKIESPIDLTNAILDFNKLNDSYFGSGFENPVLTFDELLPIVEKGITNASKIYESEQEIVLTNRRLSIPKKSQLFFIAKDELGRDRDSNRDELIEKYNLKELYKVYFVDRQEIQKYRDKWLKKEEEKFNQKFTKGLEDLELKKQQVVQELLNFFLNKSINSFKEQYEKYYIQESSETKMFYDDNSDDYTEIFWYSVPLVQLIVNKYYEIVQTNWSRFIESKRVKDLNLYSFSNFYDEVKYNLKDFFEQNKEELDKINDWREIRGNGYLSLSNIEYLLIKSVDDYENLPEWISYKELAKMYLNRMGSELYRYYMKKEIYLVSEYKDGGQADEPTEFWGTEAGGVLVYCSTTDRYLILLRSEDVLEPNTWGIISGKLDDNENDIKDAVLREAKEEIGDYFGSKLGDLIPTYIYEKPNFKFHNFISIVEEEFAPLLNWENDDYKWVKLDEMPENLHFGLKQLFQNEDINKLVKNYNNMNTQNPKDTITMDIPLLIRYSELMREDVKSDVALHQIIENALTIKDKGVLTMDDYSSIVGNVVSQEEEMAYGGQTTEQKEKIGKVMHEFKEGTLKTSYGEKVTDRQQAIAIALSEAGISKKEDGGNVESIKYKKGDIKISLDENWYSQDSNVELVPVSELIKFREFDRKTKPKYNKENSVDNINHLKFMFQKEGVKSPLIIEYSADDKSVLIIEGNHRLNSAIDLGMEYLPARVVLKKYGKYHPTTLKSTMQVSGVEPNEYGYIKSDLKPSEVGIEGTKPLVYAEGGIIEGRLHSECGDDGCGRKFQVGEGGHIIEAERDEAVIVADAFDDNEKYTIKGTPSEVASALNVMGGGKNFDKGATIEKNGQELDVPQLKKQATDTDVDDIIDSGSIIINRRSMADENEYEVTGTPKQIASAINSIDNNGVVIEKGATIQKG